LRICEIFAAIRAAFGLRIVTLLHLRGNKKAPASPGPRCLAVTATSRPRRRRSEY
jgi:hypothetical protein